MNKTNIVVREEVEREREMIGEVFRYAFPKEYIKVKHVIGKKD